MEVSSISTNYQNKVYSFWTISVIVSFFDKKSETSDFKEYI